MTHVYPRVVMLFKKGLCHPPGANAMPGVDLAQKPNNVKRKEYTTWHV